MVNKRQKTTSVKELVSCACGCGNLRPKYDRDGNERKLILGHKGLKWYKSMREKVWGNPKVISNIIKNHARYWLGRKRTKEFSINHSKFMKGKNNPFYGEKHTKESLKKIKEARAIQIIPIKDTKIELKIQNFLKLLHMEFFTHYYISEITHSYQCDIFIPSLKLVIEADGCYWHGCKICNKKIREFQEKQIEEDRIRTQELLNKGYKVIRLWEHEIKVMELNDFQEKINTEKKNEITKCKIN